MALYSFARGFLSAVGQRINALQGQEFTRLTAALSASGTTAAVESTYGWPSSGTVIVGGEQIAYSGKTATSLTGLVRPTDARAHAAKADVFLWTRDRSAVEKARLSMLTNHAEGDFLDAVGRNYGVYRILGANDATFRRIIRALAYLEGKGTRTALSILLDVLLDGTTPTVAGAEVDRDARTITKVGGFSRAYFDTRVRIANGTGKNAAKKLKVVAATDDVLTLDGRGSPWWDAADLDDEAGVSVSAMPYDLFESPFEPNIAIIRLNMSAPADPRGFAYLNGDEAATSTDTTHVTVAHTIRQVLGVWLATDTNRAGTNYATDNNFAGKVITLDTALPGANTEVVVDYGSVAAPSAVSTGVPGSAEGVASGGLLEDVNTLNDGDPIYYPLYLGDRVGQVRAVIETLLTAGKHPRYEVKLL